jgi:hypothetical protein
MMTTTAATAAALAELRAARPRAVALEALAERPAAEAAQPKPCRAVLLVVAARLRPAKVALLEATQALPIAEEPLRRAQVVAAVPRRIQAAQAAQADGRKERRAAEQAALAARSRCSPTLRSYKS